MLLSQSRSTILGFSFRDTDVNACRVDDDKELRRVLCYLLEKEGHIVASAANGEEAIKLYRKEPSDLIVMDIIMPVKDGIDTIVELRKEFPDVKIIATSGGGSSLEVGQTLKAARQIGARYTLAKPFARQQLLEAVRGILDRVD